MATLFTVEATSTPQRREMASVKLSDGEVTCLVMQRVLIKRRMVESLVQKRVVPPTARSSAVSPCSTMVMM